MFCSFPVPKSFAETFVIPLASMSKETSICGTPLGAGAIPSSLNRPRDLLSLAKGLSPWTIFMSTAVWLSSNVEKICFLLVGIVVFLGIKTVDTPPAVSIPRERGVTSRRSMLPAPSSPASFPPWIDAPNATHSSGLIPLNGSFPVIFATSSWTAGILVEPPTRRTLSSSDAWRSASFKAFLTGPNVASTRSWVNSSNFAFESVMSRCFGPSWFIVINGRFIFVVVVVESSFFAFSAASFRRCIAILSVLKSIFSVFLNSSTK